MITRIFYGFLTDNFGAEIDAKATAKAFQGRLAELFPGADITITYQPDSGSMPRNLLPVIDVDGELADDDTTYNILREFEDDSMRLVVWAE